VPLGTHWGTLEEIGNLMGTLSPPHPAPANPKEKTKPPSVHPEPSHWLHEISISKSVFHHL